MRPPPDEKPLLEAASPSPHSSSLRFRFAAWTLIYALAVFYVSVIIGPLGFHYVPRDLGEAWRALLAIKYVEHGSDQRADWMSNLAMAIPLGFLCAGVFWPQTSGLRRWIAGAAALFCCATFVIAVKYAQLFFPPRTVTLNYVIAQGLGSLLGILLFTASHRSQRLLDLTSRNFADRALNVALRIYAVALLVYFLFPFDFVLSAGDFKDRIAELSTFLFSWPGEGRPRGVRAALILANIVETIPLGMLFATQQSRPALGRIAMAGFVLMSGVFVATALTISATPNLASILLRTAGIIVGATATIQLRHVDVTRLRTSLARIVPYLWVPYILSVLYVNGLVPGHWRSFDEARMALDVRGLLPLWHYYIVSKTQAMSSLAVHAVMYAPIGILISLRNKDRSKDRSGNAGVAALTAFVFSFFVEVGRWLQPGLQPDFNDAAIAAVSAGLAIKVMPMVWLMISSLARDSAADGAQFHTQTPD